MKHLLLIAIIFCLPGYGQKDEVIKASREFHERLISNDSTLKNLLDDNLSYGHSNGWVETKSEMLQNLSSGKMKYVEIKEDSVSTVAEEKLAHIRFIAVISSVLDGNLITLRLKVLEIWRKKKTGWVLFARQAIRA